MNIKVGGSRWTCLSNEWVQNLNSLVMIQDAPTGAVCVWEGNATVILELKNSNLDTLTANLNTSIEPKTENFSNLIIEIEKVLLLIRN